MLYDNVQGLTPVRRKEDTINIGRIEAESEQEWTTARCHRLLRALTSRVAALNKEISRFSSTHADQQKLLTVARSFPLSKTRTPDEDWAAQPKKKKLKRTYGGRSRITEIYQAKTAIATTVRDRPAQYVPGELTVPTPMLTRARRVCESHDPIFEEPCGSDVAPMGVKYKLKRPDSYTYSRKSIWQLTSSMSVLRTTVDSHKFSAYEGVYAGLETLMRNTTVDEPTVRSQGAGSLFSMALRSVPALVFEQEHLLDNHMDETSSKSAIIIRDMSTEIYDDLESLGSSGNHWKHLRTVVRSHGVNIVANAIEDNLLDADVSGSLISLLVSTQAYDEAETLLQALLHRQSFAPPKTLHDALECRLNMLIKYSNHTRRFGFQYSQLARAFGQGSIPGSWLATRGFSEVWTALIVHISAEEAVALPAREFLRIALPLLGIAAHAAHGNTSSSVFALAVDDAMRNTFIGLLTTISAMSILSSEVRSQDRFDTMAIEGYEQLEHVIDSTVLSMKSVHEINSTLPLLLMSRVLMKCFKYPHDLADHCEQQKVLDQYLRITNVLQESSTFLSNLARCCGKGAYSSGFEYLQQFHLSLVRPEAKICQNNMIGCVVVDSAYDFARRYSSKEHLLYASQMDLKFTSRTNMPVPQSPEAEVRVEGGFRWEEGIGEWVTATPALHLMKRTTALTLDNLAPDTPSISRARCIAPATRSSFSPVINRGVVVELPQMTFESSPIRRKAGTVSDTEDESSQSELDGCTTTDVTDMSDDDGLFDTSTESVCISSPNHSQGCINEEQETRSLKVVINQSSDMTRAIQKPSTVYKADEDSDDELSFISVSSQSSQASWEVANTRSLRPRPKSGARKAGLRPKKRRYVDVVGDSEDELCM